ncbi:Pleckstrin homology domain-containing family A member 2 [Leucoagaricus sp. SymC.cos]|nr:Pleckstrin homology domain-containing family A member 2 [Leucoagaricus sp. SymC.cos]
MSPSVAPPTPQEIQRKLSVHSASRVKVKYTLSSSWGGGGGLISGTESDSDSILTPDIISTHAGFNPASASLMQPPLSSIAEQSPGSGGEDSDEEDDDGAGWRSVTEAARVSGATGGAGGHLRGADVVLKSGYLSKKGERRKTWKKRWFVLRPTHLAFYKNEAEYKLLRLLDLNDVHSCIPVQLKRHSHTFGLILPKRTYYLQAGSARDVQEWVEAIEDARQTLMATSTQNSGNNPTITPTSAPIPVPQNPSTLRPPPISISPEQNLNALSQIVSSSDSDDALSQLAPPPPPGGERGGGMVVPSPTKLTFAPHQLPPSPNPPKEVSKIILSGYLMKCGSKRRNWRKRWFTLTADKLFYSRSHMDMKPHRVFAFSDILDAMDCDLPKRRLGTSVGSATTAPGSGGGAVDLGVEGQQQRNFIFKIVMTKRNLLLCAPSEEDEIRWLGAVRALIVRRSGAGVLPGQSTSSQQQQVPFTAGASIAAGGVGGGGGGGGIKSKVRRLSAGAGVLGGGGGGKPSTISTTILPAGAGSAAAIGGDDSREPH